MNTKHTIRSFSESVGLVLTKALILEVLVTPKPGLVDRNNTGSHGDMNRSLFEASARALQPFFVQATAYACKNSQLPSPELFAGLRTIGLSAERAMFHATAGVNTHKGAIFSLLILCGALGRAYAAGLPVSLLQLSDLCAAIGKHSLGDFEHALPDTSGKKAYLAGSISGARGEAAGGFKTAIDFAYPELIFRMTNGYTLNSGAAAALLGIIARTDDTCMIHRGGLEEAARCKAQAAELFRTIQSQEQLQQLLEQLDRDYISKNLSPGGSADILAVTLALFLLSSNGIIF